MSKLTEEEVQTATMILNKLDGGFIPEPLFLEFTRLTTSAILEIVPYRIINDDIQVLLLERAEDDPNWAGMLHTPGTVIRSTDSIESAQKRILTSELGINELREIKYLTTVLHKVNRGNELAIVYTLELSENKVGEYYSLSDLPSNVVDTQLKFFENLKVVLK